MRENEFEKQVQQKMGAFDLHPSGEVWMEVERRIRKEKKRRFIFWWPLFFLLTGGGIATVVLLGKNKEKIASTTPDRRNENTLQPTPVNDAAEGSAGNFESADQKSTAGTPNDRVVIKEKENETSPTGKPANVVLTGNKPFEKVSASKKKTGANKKIITPDNIVSTDKENKVQDDKGVVTLVTPPGTPAVLQDTNKVIDLAIITRKEIPGEKKQTEPVQPKTDSAAGSSKDQAAKKSKKWDWGISLSGGRSALVNGLHFFEKAYGSSSQLFVSPGMSDPQAARNIRPSASFGAGLYIKRPVSKKLDINLGLGYTYLSTRMYVGNRVDSIRVFTNNYSQGISVNEFYRPAGNVSHTNQYHFISLSADASWRIIDGKKMKLYWDNGISYNRLLSSSMLHYAWNLPGYYKDNNQLIRDQFFFSTGLSVPVSRRMTINPFASYSLLPVIKHTDSLQAHYYNYGIRIRLLLNKK